VSIIDVLKEAGKLAKELNRIDLYQQLLDVQVQMADLKTENIELKEKVRELERKADIESSLVFEHGIYWIKADKVAGGRDTPICPRCWDEHRTVVRTVVRGFPSTGDKHIHCTACKAHHKVL
jgi:hypothetical protein